MCRRITSLALALSLAFSIAKAHSKHKPDPVFAQITSIVQKLSEISGLSQEHPVAYGRMTKAQLRHFLAKRIKRTLKPEEIRADELALKMFGLVPRDFNLKKSTIELLTEQAAAFYDYDEKKLFLLSGSDFEDETTTLAHELSHALADQHFDLDHFMDEAPTNDDENLAHTAVVEGQASWLMIAYNLTQEGQPADPTPEMLKSIENSDQDSMSDFPVLKGSPLYIQQSLLFPYAEGTAFFDAVYRKMGKRSFTEVFSEAPVDTSQIIHPERYFAHQRPVMPDLTKLPAGMKDEITEGSVGEFDHQMLLRQYVSEKVAAELAPHLKGGQFKIYAQGRAKRPVLSYASGWDSKQQAKAFFKAYERVLQKKWTECSISSHTDDLFAGTGDNGYFITRLSGTTVSSVEGIADLRDWDQLKPPDESSMQTDGVSRSTLREARARSPRLR
jgi:hypothetical protein